MTGSCAEKSGESTIGIASPVAGEPVYRVNRDRMDAGFPLASMLAVLEMYGLSWGGSYGETQPVSSWVSTLVNSAAYG
jgi:hypothetical protein